MKAGPLEYTAELTSGDRNQVRDTEGKRGRNKCTPGALWVMELDCATMGQCQIIEQHIQRKYLTLQLSRLERKVPHLDLKFELHKISKGKEHVESLKN